jgi:hypothetical protein
MAIDFLAEPAIAGPARSVHAFVLASFRFPHDGKEGQLKPTQNSLRYRIKRFFTPLILYWTG